MDPMLVNRLESAMAKATIFDRELKNKIEALLSIENRLTDKIKHLDFLVNKLEKLEKEQKEQA